MFCYDKAMKNITLQVIGFALMLLGIQGAIRLAANNDAGLLSWLHADTSLLIGINVVFACAGIYLIRIARGQSEHQARP